MAAAANIGESIIPKNEYRIPAAIRTPAALQSSAKKRFWRIFAIVVIARFRVKGHTTDWARSIEVI